MDMAGGVVAAVMGSRCERVGRRRHHPPAMPEGLVQRAVESGLGTSCSQGRPGGGTGPASPM